MRPLSLLLLVFSTAVGVCAQHSQPSDITPLLLPALGHPNHPIATKNAEGQKYFDQGLQLVFGFNRAEAVRSFRRASQLDPQAAMPYWGEALAYGRHMNMDQDMDVSPSEAYEAIQKALKLSSAAPPNEREYIQALAERCAHGENINWQQRDEAYAAAMQRLAAHYPDDLDATALSLEARMVLHRYEWFQGSTPEHSTPEIMNDIESLLRRAPDHPLANHLYIHILDTGHPEMALGVAYRLGTVAPGLGHLVHMPSHIFFNLGDYEMAAHVNEQASVAEERYMHAHVLHARSSLRRAQPRRAGTLRSRDGLRKQNVSTHCIRSRPVARVLGLLPSGAALNTPALPPVGRSAASAGAPAFSSGRHRPLAFRSRHGTRR
jgi:hypothetical protein